MLSRELKALAQSGLIVRKDYGVVPPKVEYRLTPTGRSIAEEAATAVETPGQEVVRPLEKPLKPTG